MELDIRARAQELTLPLLTALMLAMLPAGGGGGFFVGGGGGFFGGGGLGGGDFLGGGGRGGGGRLGGGGLGGGAGANQVGEYVNHDCGMGASAADPVAYDAMKPADPVACTRARAHTKHISCPLRCWLATSTHHVTPTWRR